MEHPPIEIGFVVLKAIRVIADTPWDDDPYPDVTPWYDLTVRFSPKLRRVIQAWPEGDRDVLVDRDMQDATVNDDGVLVDANLREGIWVVAGTHVVTVMQGPNVVETLEIEVTTAHTEADPLDLGSHLTQPEPPEPLPGVEMRALALTQAQYDALSGYDPGTVYVVIGAA